MVGELYRKVGNVLVRNGRLSTVIRELVVPRAVYMILRSNHQLSAIMN